MICCPDSNTTKIVHFRVKSQDRTLFEFTYLGTNMEIVANYKYLGVLFDEYSQFKTIASMLASAAGRALGSIYSKFKKLNGLGFNTYTKMFNCGVTPILDYSSGVWGFKKFSKCDTVQNRAIRLFLGVYAFALN